MGSSTEAPLAVHCHYLFTYLSQIVGSLRLGHLSAIITAARSGTVMASSGLSEVLLV